MDMKRNATKVSPSARCPELALQAGARSLLFRQLTRQCPRAIKALPTVRQAESRSTSDGGNKLSRARGPWLSVTRARLRDREYSSDREKVTITRIMESPNSLGS